MRNRVEQNGIGVSAVAGFSAILLSINLVDESLKTGLLGFAIKRDDLTEDESFFLKAFKHFPQTAKQVGNGELFSTQQHPVQSFLWEDFSVKSDHAYKYHIIPVYGKPAKLVFKDACEIEISTEKHEGSTHAVYFNRGVAGSLAFAREFKNQAPGDMTEEERQRALQWLSRGLVEALLGFIEQATDESFGIRAVFYEFTYVPVLEALQAAIDRGVDVKIIYDSRLGPKEENDAAIKEAGLNRRHLIRRENEPDDKPAHNKFMVLLKDDEPVKVWTGSTNITDKGIFGQCNTGHIVQNPDVAQAYLSYWEALSEDPDENTLQEKTLELQPEITDLSEITQPITVFFSPRSKKKVLETYASFVRGAQQMVCGMFPFSFNKSIKEALGEESDNLKYILVDKIGNAKAISTNDRDVVIVNGDFFAKEMFDWLIEVNSGILLNKNHNGVIGTNFIHNKVMLIDPLSEHPVVITGSANFSDPSITANDENTMIIKDNLRVADLYFAEFVRVFNHYFVRNAVKKINANGNGNGNPLHLVADDSWVAKFEGSVLKAKRQALFTNMFIPEVAEAL